MPREKIQLSTHDLELLAKVSDMIVVQENGNRLIVEAKHHQASEQKKRRNLYTRKAKEDNPEIKRAFARLGI